MVASSIFRQLKLPLDWDDDRWYYERWARDNGYLNIAGMDEAGRGPLAGPVVAAAVILPFGIDLPGVDDSKKLSDTKRRELAASIRKAALGVGLGEASVNEIESLNILQATFLAMKRALAGLKIAPEMVLIDGPYTLPDLEVPQKAIPKGDQLSVSISAASIIAKVTRDDMMIRYHKAFPQYNFKANKGYGTKEHLRAIRKFGCCPIHRKTFKGVR